ncbi:signal peptidase I [candidate division KSB1 bacterium]|nr:signal peptidase I [candidate division KSB1 bacterium]
MSENIKNQNKKKWWIAGLLSYLVPGLGQFYNGDAIRGLFLFCIYSLWGSIIFNIALIIMKADFPGISFVGLIILLFITLCFLVCIIIDAIRQAKKTTGEHPFKAYHRWYFYVLVILITSGISFSTKIVLNENIIKAYKIPTGSMMPTLLPGDYLLSNRSFYCANNVNRGDVIIFQSPEEERWEWIKRVVGLPGDTLEIKNYTTFINGSELDENYLLQDKTANQAFEMKAPANFGPVYIPPEHYFVLGDNRENSHDSRNFGLIARAGIKGKPSLIYISWSGDFPFIRFSRIGKKINT